MSVFSKIGQPYFGLLEKTHAYTEETCQLHLESFQANPVTFSLKGNSSTSCADLIVMTNTALLSHTRRPH